MAQNYHDRCETSLKTETGPPPAGDGPSGSRQSHLET
jgi:hypothetical protein